MFLKCPLNRSWSFGPWYHSWWPNWTTLVRVQTRDLSGAPWRQRVNRVYLVKDPKSLLGCLGDFCYLHQTRSWTRENKLFFVCFLKKNINKNLIILIKGNLFLLFLLLELVEETWWGNSYSLWLVNGRYFLDKIGLVFCWIHECLFFFIKSWLVKKGLLDTLNSYWMIKFKKIEFHWLSMVPVRGASSFLSASFC